MTRIGVIKRLGVVAFVLLLASNYVAYFEIEVMSLGGRVLDLRPLGYTPTEAQEFALGLSFEARQAYTNAYLILDVVFIGFLTALLVTIAGTLRPRRFWWAITACAAAFALADLAENVMVYHIVWGDASNAAAASLATRIKFAALLLAAAATITSWRQEEPQR